MPLGVPRPLHRLYCGAMTAPGMPVLRGRARELGELDSALERVRAGESVVLVVRGEAGIGKTAMLTYVADAAAGCRVLHVVGAESELELPFAGLHQVCGPLLALAQAVPPHQEQALRVALGLADGPLQTGSWSASPSSACLPRSGPPIRWRCWSMTLSGSTRRPARSSVWSRDAWSRSPS